MVTREVDLLARDLVRLLSDLGSLHGDLANLMRAKLEAMKVADSDTIQSITARELLLAERAAEREGLRRQITSRILVGLGMVAEPAKGNAGRQKGAAASAPAITLNELAELFPEPRRSQLLVSAAGLREKVTEIDRLRTTTSMVTDAMLNHLSEVLKVMSAGLGCDVYSRSGQRQRSGVAAVFEAVG